MQTRALPPSYLPRSRDWFYVWREVSSYHGLPAQMLACASPVHCRSCPCSLPWTRLGYKPSVRTGRITSGPPSAWLFTGLSLRTAHCSFVITLFYQPNSLGEFGRIKCVSVLVLRISTGSLGELVEVHRDRGEQLRF